jgi:putative PIN family toxin of toxin-antitoxin system
VIVPERVVFDTNIWISGILWRGDAHRCLLLARTGLVRVVYCDQMLAELCEKLRKAFGFSGDRIQAVVYDVRRMAEHVEIPDELHVVDADPDDDMFVECAVVGKAQTIVSHDRHLLRLGRYADVQIVSAAAFIECFTRGE